MSLLANKELIDQLGRSEIYCDYERAFGETTGLRLTLRPVEDFHLAHHGKRHENPFCALMAKRNRTCAACLDAQQKTSDPSLQQTRTVMCFAGLCESAVPLRSGEDLLGFLQTGEVMLRKPTCKQFSKIAHMLVQWGIGDDLKKVEEAWLQTKVVSRKRQVCPTAARNFCAAFEHRGESAGYPVQPGRAAKYHTRATVHPGAPRRGAVSSNRSQGREHE